VKERVILPGYFTEKPLFPAVALLRRKLGYQDAILQLHELGIRTLERQSISQGENKNSFLKEQFESVGIPLGTFEFDDLRLIAAQSYIVQTYSIVERFFRDLISQYIAIKEIESVRWRTKDSSGGNLAPFEELCENLPDQAKRIVLEKPESKLLTYYRLVRVSVEHRSDEAKEKAIRFYERLNQDHRDYFRDTYDGLLAPNLPSKVTFDDFLLFTRATKYFANVVNDACDLNLEEISHFVSKIDSSVIQIIQNAETWGAKKHVLNKYLKNQFGLRNDDLNYLLIENILKEITSRIKNQKSKV